MSKLLLSIFVNFVKPKDVIAVAIKIFSYCYSSNKSAIIKGVYSAIPKKAKLNATESELEDFLLSVESLLNSDEFSNVMTEFYDLVDP